MTDSGPFKAQQTIAGRFTIAGLLGSDALGTRYDGQDSQSGARVAIKALRADIVAEGVGAAQLQAYAQELQAKAGNVAVPVLAAGEEAGHLYLVSPVVDAQSLHHQLAASDGEGNFASVSSVRRTFGALLGALESLHGAGLVHGHLKPDNVLVRRNEAGDQYQVRLTDIGLCQFVDPAKFAAAGIPRSLDMLPDQNTIGGKAQVDQDLYAVGVMLYQMLTNERPEGEFQLPTAVNQDLPASADSLIEVSMSPLEGDRFRSAADFADAVSGGLADGSSGKRIPRKALIAVGLLALIASAAAFYLSQKEPPTEQELASWKAEALSELRATIKPAADPANIEALRAEHPDMIYVPAGAFLYGDLQVWDHERLRASGGELVQELPGYWIDKWEYPNIDPSNPAITDENRERLLVPAALRGNGDAEQKCIEDGKRLCSAQEWEKACRGPKNQIYSYGDQYDPSVCPDPGMDPQSTYHNGEFDKCTSGYGVMHMSGGLFEWTNTSKSGKRVVRDGSPGDPQSYTRCGYSTLLSPVNADQNTGFRCCLSE